MYLGLRDEARAEFENLTQHDFADIPRDALWATCLVYLAEVCAFLGDAERAAVLYRLLLPYARYTIVAGGGVACYGAASRYLGLLAATMCHWEEAERHFEAALGMNSRLGARPWLAHTQAEYAAMLLARGQACDHEKAGVLLNDAAAIARVLGMRSLEERIAAHLTHAASPPPTAAAYPDDLSPREVEVLRLLTTGRSNRDIADSLCINLSTVATHVRNILSKTTSANRAEAAAYARRHGLSSPSPGEAPP